MDEETKRALKWALNQKYHSVAAEYAKILATHIERTNDVYESVINSLVEHGYLEKDCQEIDRVKGAFDRAMRDSRKYRWRPH
ncbi:MAG: hypothetical protein JW885_02625 [Deltaproteobacteria bacterium]|nr:hypothetical protein [Candidatus Zymogenaceae bacterium]